MTLVDRWRLELSRHIRLDSCLAEMLNSQRSVATNATPHWPFGPSRTDKGTDLLEALRFFEQCHLLETSGHVDAGLFGLMLPEEIKFLLERVVPLLASAPHVSESEKRWLNYATAFLRKARGAAAEFAGQAEARATERAAASATAPST